MIDLSVRSKARVWAGSIFGTLFCVAAAVLVDSPNFSGFTSDQLARALATDVLLPTALAGPLLFLLLRQIRALAIARDEMAIMATTDSLTGVLNRGAFTMMVETYLAQTKNSGTSAYGSLLVIDADHFKSINDDFGHSVGDMALQEITAKIQSSVRPVDLVGRIGGEEFGVFLPATSEHQAAKIAECIRENIRNSPFPDIDQFRLSVSIGGVTFHEEGSYDRLFKVADRGLYLAKDMGRNQVSMLSYAERLIA